jgi:ABC-type glycerol-3-phosphate transport system permease component
MPGFVVVIIWQFTQAWNEFLFAVTLTSGTGKEPITVALSNLAGGRSCPVESAHGWSHYGRITNLDRLSDS